MKQLTPLQRALIQFLESMLITGLLTGASAIAGLLNGPGAINWHLVLITFALAFVFSLAHTLAMYLKPMQPDLSALIELIASELEKRYGKPALVEPEKTLRPEKDA